MNSEQRTVKPIVSDLYIFCDDPNDWWAKSLALTASEPEIVGEQSFVYKPVMVSEDEDWIDFVRLTQKETDVFIAVDKSFEPASFVRDLISYYVRYTKPGKFSLQLITVDSNGDCLKCLCLINRG
ncbi:MAG: hypothetical protein WCO30_01860 [bacterium]